MKTTVERVDDTTVKLSVTVEADRVGTALDEAAGRLASQVKVPGFRPGRVPRRVLESRLGKDALTQEAVRESLPQFYAEAAQAEKLEVVGPPDFELETFEEGQEAAFSATVEVRPQVEVPEYQDLQIAHPEWEVSEDDVAEQLNQLRERFAELETVERPAEAGDYVVVTIVGERDGERLDEVCVEDLLYEIPVLGEGEEYDSALDSNVIGASAGDVLEFSDTLGPDYGDLAGVEVDLIATVGQVKSKQLPELDDDFAITASEFDTIEELRSELESQLASHKKSQARAELRGKVVEAVSELVEVPLPNSLVEQEVNFRLNRLLHEAEHYEMSLETYLAAVGRTAEQVVEEFTQDARKTVKAQLVIDAIGNAAEIQVTQEDLGAEVARQAMRLGRPPEEVAEFMTQPDRIPALVSDAFRRKTIDHLVASVQVLSAPPDENDDGEPPVDAGDGMAADVERTLLADQDEDSQDADDNSQGSDDSSDSSSDSSSEN